MQEIFLFQMSHIETLKKKTKIDLMKQEKNKPEYSKYGMNKRFKIHFKQRRNLNE